MNQAAVMPELLRQPLAYRFDGSIQLHV